MSTSRAWNNPGRYEEWDLTEKPTQFALKTAELGLSESEYADSPELCKWVRKNKNFRYVQEPLLYAWGMEVKHDMTRY